MVTVFRDSRVIILLYYLEKGRTIKGQNYADLYEGIDKKTVPFDNEKGLFSAIAIYSEADRINFILQIGPYAVKREKIAWRKAVHVKLLMKSLGQLNLVTQRQSKY